MEHDFVLAFSRYQAGGHTEDDIKKIQFALRFTEQALNGEVSEGMFWMGGNAGDCNDKDDAEAVFKAMINKLAEECEG